MAFDGLTDVLFEKSNHNEVTLKLKDIWTAVAEHRGLQLLHFDLRLIPLNKVYPKEPKPQQCRPMVVSSPLVKLLEVRLKKKLDEYMTDKLISSQTGFVPNTGISVNQMRLLNRVLERSAAPISGARKHVFGLFLDFSSAYNTVLHSRLFVRLKRALTSDDIQLIKAIYSRSRIRLGKHHFAPNIGVAQGSVISPALFNIYCEDLYEGIRDDAYVKEDDMLGYADDLLIIFTSIVQLKKAAAIIKSWCTENNLKINAQKSGILEFVPRLGKDDFYLQLGSEIEGIPVVDKYKYLGLWVDRKLTMEPQLKYIKEKANFLTYRLYPLLKCTSLDYRINLWKILVRPLFEMMSGLYYNEAESNKQKTLRLLRKTFKDFTLLKKNVDNVSLDKLMDYDFEQRASESQIIATIKWEARKNHSVPRINPEFKKRKRKNDMGKKVLYPKEIQEYLNIKTAKCPACNIPCSSMHMLEAHNVYTPTNESILNECVTLSNAGFKSRKTRGNILGDIADYIKLF